MRKVKVRLLVPVTYGHNGPAWQVGDVVEVGAALARLMVREGEAVYQTAMDTTVAVIPRVRHA